MNLNSDFQTATLIEQFLTRSRSKTEKKPAKKKKKRGPSIQALGHSYAAARPVRKCSEQNPYGWGGGLQQMMEMYPCDQCEKTFPQPYRFVGSAEGHGRGRGEGECTG